MPLYNKSPPDTQALINVGVGLLLLFADDENTISSKHD